MRSIKMYTSAAVALVAVALGATSAPAANWDPPNSIVAATGAWTLTTNVGGSITCTITFGFRSTGNDVLTSTAPPVFDACSSNIANPTTVTSASNWTLTATTTTAVDVAGSYNVNIGGGLCVVTVSAAVAGNTWSNSAHTLTLNSAAGFPIVEHGFCDGGTVGHWGGTMTFASSAIVT
jgi:hypothetical protein